MKQCICIILVLMLLFGCYSAMGESDMQDSFTPTSANTVGLPASEWFTTSMNRAVLTLLLALDASSYDKTFSAEDVTSFLSNTTYVGLSDGLLYVSGYIKDSGITILYDPSTEQAVLLKLPLDVPEMATALVEATLQNSVGDNYKKNDEDDIVNAYGLLMSMLS